jgi:hypothetical protein
MNSILTLTAVRDKMIQGLPVLFFNKRVRVMLQQPGCDQYISDTRLGYGQIIKTNLSATMRWWSFTAV